MCGIAAIFAGSSANAPVDRDELLRIRESMTKRGPDGAGVWLSADGRVGLAHRRLAILDLTEAGAQPMTSSCGRLHLVFNGEIYNHRALRAELEAQGVEFCSHSDTEVILELYRRRGPDMLDRLRGMFALALWDENKRGMLLARDHFGIKPLYVADDGKTLRAASQVKALMAGGAVSDAPDPAGHAGFFLWGHVPEPHSLYRAVRPLAAGAWLWAGENGERRSGSFFNMRAELAAPALPADTPLHADETLRQALLDSVRGHLESDVPVGVFLSAGLDSATLTALVGEISAAPPLAVTLAFDEFAGTPADEAPLAGDIARLYGAKHAIHRIAADDFAACRAQIVADMDQPSIDGINTWFVARAARREGLKVALSGLGGDELFAGYNHFSGIPRLVRGLAPFGLCPPLGRALRRLSAPWIGRFAPVKAAGLAEYGPSFGGAYLLRRGLFMPWELPHILDPDMARDGLRALDEKARLNQSIAGIGLDRLKITALETGCYMRNQLLRDSDWAGMAHSLEIRTPLVDIGLFRAVLPLIKAGLPAGKTDMAAAARPPLPAALLERKKTGFSIPVSQWRGETSLRAWAKALYDGTSANG